MFEIEDQSGAVQKGKRKTGRAYRRFMAVRHKAALMGLIRRNICTFRAGYVDRAWVDGVIQPVGKYIKYPRNSNAQQYLKRYSNKIIRKRKEIYQGSQYRKCFDYWWILY